MICPWMDGSRTTHMYRTYGIRAMQELLPRSNYRGAEALAGVFETVDYTYKLKNVQLILTQQ